MQMPANQLKSGVILLIITIATFSGLNIQVHGTDVSALRAATDSSGTAVFALCPPVNDTTGKIVTAQAGVTSSPAVTPSDVGGPGYLGAEVTAADSCGVLVLGTLSDSPAAGLLRTGDVIVAIDCMPLTSTVINDIATSTVSSTGTPPGAVPASCSGAQAASGKAGTASAANHAEGPTILSTFFVLVESHQAGEQILLTLDRNNQEMNITVTLGAISEGAMPFAATSASTQESSGSTAGGASGAASESGSGSTSLSQSTTAPFMSPTAPGSVGAGSASSGINAGSGGSSFSQPTTAPLGLPTAGSGESGFGGAAGGNGAGSAASPVPPPLIPPTSSGPTPSPAASPVTVPLRSATPGH